jgi:diguanylate cyclase (GGDEF)-like protein
VSQLLAARGHEVCPFVNGRQALEHISNNANVDVLMTSTEPEGLSGVELCWEARLLANSGRPLHIMLMSSNFDEKHLIQALDCGADDFIGKPPAAQELYARLRCAERLMTMQRELVCLAATDPLTGVLNRRAFFQRAQSACERAARGEALSAVMLDVDHFKTINDEHGHDVGDQALRAVADAAARGNDVVGRIGGEEFAILLADTDQVSALEGAERLRAAIAELRIRAAGRTVTMTCSFGAAEWSDGDSIDRFLKRADDALYEAKRSGRNRVIGSPRVKTPDDHGNRRSLIRAIGRT